MKHPSRKAANAATPEDGRLAPLTDPAAHVPHTGEKAPAKRKTSAHPKRRRGEPLSAPDQAMDVRRPDSNGQRNAPSNGSINSKALGIDQLHQELLDVRLHREQLHREIAEARAELLTLELERTQAHLRRLEQPAQARGIDPTGGLRWMLNYQTTVPLEPPDARFDPQRMDLHWIMTRIGPGMGGPMTIFRLIQQLERRGHRNTIWMPRAGNSDDGEKLRRMIRNRYLPIVASVKTFKLGKKPKIEGDAVIATHYTTAYVARAVRNVRERFYLVQDYEPQFDPMGARHLLAEETYRFGFHALAASPWLRDLMTSRYDVPTHEFDLAVDHAIYRKRDDLRRRRKHIAFYGRSHTPRRAVELGCMALELVHRRYPDIFVHFFGGDREALDVPYEHQVHGHLDPAELAELYGTVELGMVFSATNVSLIPREMMACGLPVVELTGPSTRSVFMGGEARLADPRPDAIADAICELLDDPARRKALSRQGWESVQPLTWEQSAKQIDLAVRSGVLAKDPDAFATTAQQALTPANPLRRGVQRLSAALSKTPTTFSFHRPVIWAAQPEYFHAVYHDDLADHCSTEFRITSADSRMLRRLPDFVRQHQAKTVIIFRPEWLAQERQVFRDLRRMGVSVIGYSTEPAPQSWDAPHPDQIDRLDSLLGAKALDYDLIIHYDASSLDLLRDLGFRRLIAHPLPTSRRLFYPENRTRDFEICFTGKSTAYRESFLGPLKARYNVVHAAHGLTDDDCRDLMNRSRLVLNIHNEPYPNFEHRVVQALFCGRPVLSEPLSGDLLQPNRDYVSFTNPRELMDIVAELLESPEDIAPAIDHDRFTIAALTRRLGLDDG